MFKANIFESQNSLKVLGSKKTKETNPDNQHWLRSPMPEGGRSLSLIIITYMITGEYVHLNCMFCLLNVGMYVSELKPLFSLKYVMKCN